MLCDVDAFNVRLKELTLFATTQKSIKAVVILLADRYTLYYVRDCESCVLQ